MKVNIEGYSRALSDATKVVINQIEACAADGCSEVELAAFESIKSENEAEAEKATAMLSAMAMAENDDSGASVLQATSFLYLALAVVATF